ncbi:hypothetical protein DXV76_04690 [Rhodobacteraceae bacterium CCMM004]|nr:hypothetical protein DXV76_04690 [Rhodobacteraceae bacterium CCMM004]
MPLPIRLALAALRACVAGVAVAVTAWVSLAGPTPQERAALDLASGVPTGDDRAALRSMRLAGAAMAVAPEMAVALVLSRAPAGVTAADVERAYRRIAAGDRVPPMAQPTPTEHAARATPARRDIGARFLTPGG